MNQGEDNQDIAVYFNQGEEQLDIDEYLYWQNQQYLNYNILNDTYDTLCVIECDIINKVMDKGVVNDGIKKAISLIRQQKHKMPTCIVIKLIQVSQLLLQCNDPILDEGIKEFQQLVKNYEKVDQQLNLIENTENYEISKAFIYDYKDIYFVSLCPNEKYILPPLYQFTFLYILKYKI